MSTEQIKEEVGLKKRSRLWTPEEDAELKEYMTTNAGQNEDTRPPNRSKRACYRRWFRLNKPGPLVSSQDEWTEEEDAMALGGHEEIEGRSYAAIEKRRSIILRSMEKKKEEEVFTVF